MYWKHFLRQRQAVQKSIGNGEQLDVYSKVKRMSNKVDIIHQFPNLQLTCTFSNVKNGSYEITVCTDVRDVYFLMVKNNN